MEIGQYFFQFCDEASQHVFKIYGKSIPAGLYLEILNSFCPGVKDTEELLHSKFTRNSNLNSNEVSYAKIEPFHSSNTPINWTINSLLLKENFHIF